MEKVYRTVIIDDEESAIDNLCFELQRYSYISVEGKAKTGTLGLKIIERVRPDLVFLDVELPDMHVGPTIRQRNRTTRYAGDGCSGKTGGLCFLEYENRVLHCTRQICD